MLTTFSSRIVFSLLIFLGSPYICLADGGLSLSQTRVIFDAKAKNAKITLNNQSDKVYLINSRVLNKPEEVTNNGQSIPFMVTPPLFRLEKESYNTVLIVPNDTSSLPTDRESVFYLSFLAIPSTKKNEVMGNEGTSTQVSFGIRTLIKLFYRPNSLGMSSTEAAEKLKFVQQNQQLKVINPTPYYLTLGELMVDQSLINVREQGAMLSPFSSQSYSVAGNLKQVKWSVINDYGSLSDIYHAPVTIEGN